MILDKNVNTERGGNTETLWLNSSTLELMCDSLQRDEEGEHVFLTDAAVPCQFET